MPRFVDRVVIHAAGGQRRSRLRLGPSREVQTARRTRRRVTAARGGSIVLSRRPQVHTLLDFHFHPHVDAPSGKQGAGNTRDGARWLRPRVKVPDGTVVLDENGRLLADLVGAGTRFEAAAAEARRTRQRRAGVPGPARRPASRCSARRARSATSRSNSRPSPTSAWSGFPSAGKSSFGCPSSRRPSRRSPTIRSPRLRPTWAWCRRGTTPSPSPMCRA